MPDLATDSRKFMKTTLENLSGLGVGDNSFVLIRPTLREAAEQAIATLEHERGWKFEIAVIDDDGWLWYRRAA
jgi:hypothetical protein